MQGLAIRIAKALNKLMSRKGSVFADHYHSRLLSSPTELVNAIRYVLENAAKHYGTSGADAYSSLQPLARAVLAEPRGWLLRSGLQRARNRPHWMRV